jgi:transcriptional regulator of aromatic amino acid metabolism
MYYLTNNTMKNLFFTLTLLIGSFLPLLAQKTNTTSKNQSTLTNMKITASFEQQVLEFLYEAFPDSKSVPSQQMKASIHMVLQKGVQYGLNNEEDLAVYAITSYVLGENFDEEVPEAAMVLQNKNYSSRQKAELLESFAKQVVTALEQDEHLAQQVATKQQAMLAQKPTTQANEASMDEYLSMQMTSQPYQQLASWATEQLRKGDMAAVLKKFSPNFTNYLGLPKVEKVFQEQMIPFFTASTGITESITITMTHDGFGSEGYAFYMNLNSSQGIKPFIVYVVKEKGQLVIANLILNKSYEDMH